jgi:CDP-diacylglycerol---glycerol-3-phosphate 3-phosphatidyltransferase
MKDIYFSFVAAGLTAIALASYGVRLAIRGVAQSDRTDKVQTSVLLGKGLVEMGYWAITPIARGCVKLGLTANGLTWISLATGIGTGVAFAFGMFGLATFLALITTMGDVLDGQVARMTGKSSDAGEVLDASVDRYVEFAGIAGLVIFYRASLPALLITLGALLASFMVSYSTAKAEALQIPPPKGPMRRHERGVYMIFGSFGSSIAGAALAARFPTLPPALPQLVALAMICFIGNYSAVLRFVRTAKALRARGP